MDIHDHKLETRGHIEEGNIKDRTFALPFNKELRKKKKYKHIMLIKPKANP